MKISIREALFGGEEVDDWEPSKSFWIMAKAPNTYEWTPEFMATGKASHKNSAVKFDRIISFQGEILTRKNCAFQHNASKGGHAAAVWHNPDYDISILWFLDLSTFNETLLERTKDWLDNMSSEEREALLDNRTINHKDIK